MTGPSRLTRRAFVRIVVGVAALGGAAAVIPRVLDARREKSRSALNRILDRLDGAGEIGRAYLEQHPAERDEELLTQAIFAGLDGSYDSMSEKQLGDYLVARSGRDFEEGESVRVRDWILSKTEARLYALAFLHAS